MLAPTLAGHAGGPAIEGEVTDAAIADAVERAMDEAGFETAHLVGNSLGGYIALQLAARGRARSVVALAPAGGWAVGDESFRDTLDYFTTMQQLLRDAAPHADAIVATPEGRRRATLSTSERFEHIPPELLAHQIRGAAACTGAAPLIAYAEREGWRSTPSGSTAPCGSSGGSRTGCCTGRARPRASARTGCRRRTGSSSTASGTARSSTSRWRRRS